MSMLNIAGLQIKNLTTYNEYLTDIIIAVIVYLSAFAMLIKSFIGKRGKKSKKADDDITVETSIFEEDVTVENKNEGEATL